MDNIENANVSNQDKKVLLQSLRQLTINQSNEMYYTFAENESNIDRILNLL